MNKIFASVLLVLAAGAPAARAGEMLPGPLPARLVRVVDGDTIAVEARIWLGQSVAAHVRLRGIDAPEARGACARETRRAQAAAARLAALLGEGPVHLSRIEGGKYHGRVVADVETADGRSAADILRREGHARAYAGERRRGWC